MKRLVFVGCLALFGAASYKVGQLHGRTEGLKQAQTIIDNVFGSWLKKSGRSKATQDIIFDTRADADRVLDDLRNLMADYGIVTVKDMYEESGLLSDYTNNLYGWYTLKGAHISKVTSGYRINLPPPVKL